MIKKKYNIKELNRYVAQGRFTVEKHEEADIFIYGYSQMDSNSQSRRKWDGININLRGLIVDGEGNVLSRSFQKFFTFRNYVSNDTVLLSDQQIVKIPTGNIRIFEKIDGTFTVLYWIKDVPYLATQRSFRSPKAIRATEILHEKYSHTFQNLDKSKTYIFEAIYPETKVLVDNGLDEKLILLGIIDTLTGKDYELEDIGFPITKEYTKELKYLQNLKDLQDLNLPNKEGFVVRYDNGLRIKIKFPWYQRAHRVFDQIIAYKNAAYQLEDQLRDILGLSDNKLSKEKVWKMLENGYSLSDISKNISDVFYSLGAEEWLKNQFEEYVEYKRNKNSLDDFNFKNDEVFDYDKRISLPESESVVWNRMKRLEEQFN